MRERVRIVEVGPRDGLQNEAVPVPPATRIAFIEKLIAAGLTSIEAGSFVSPKWVPQMAGTAEVLKAFAGRPDISLPVLVPNRRGFERARACPRGAWSQENKKDQPCGLVFFAYYGARVT